MSQVYSIVQERDRLFSKLYGISGLIPIPSRANFVLCRVPEGMGQHVYQALAKRGIFVRYYSAPLLQDYIRISVGLPHHNQALLEALKAIFSEGES